MTLDIEKLRKEFRWTMADILAVVAEETGVSAFEIRGERRTARVSEARRLVIGLLHDLCPTKSQAQMGRFLNRNHTTIHAARRRCEEDLQIPRFAELYQRCKRVLGTGLP